VVGAAFGVCFLFGAEMDRWLLLAFVIAVVASLRGGWAPALLASALSTALVWRFYRVPGDLTKFWLELLRDLLGLLGAVLTAWAFFRFEHRKRQAEAPRIVQVGDPDLRKEMETSGLVLDRRVLGPDDVDARLTFWGLVLISASFFVSIGLTIGEYCKAF
jgi:hypothetical protein